MCEGTTQPAPERRTSTPVRLNPDGSRTITVQRSCNGCGSSLGDATDLELDCAMGGLMLPDVRDECGCLGAVS